MSLTYRTLVLNFTTPAGQPCQRGTATFTPSSQLTDTADAVTIGLPQVIDLALTNTISLVTTDNASIAPSGWYYNVVFSGLPSGTVIPSASFLLPYGGGTPVDYSAVTTVQPSPSPGIWLAQPSGTATAGNIPTATGVGEASAWTPPVVSSVFSRTGAVAATSGDYAVGQVTGAAPTASPTFTGTPAAPTPAALDNSTKLATTAYADAAVGVETARAETAEALLAPKASPTFTGTVTEPVTVNPSNAVAVSANAATVPVNASLTSVTNNAAGAVTITIATAGAVDGQRLVVRFYDFSNVQQALAWVNTEDSVITAPAISNGSTTLPLTAGFIFNGQTSKWRTVGVV